jgi:membrane associated rhomboid family serine protease
VLSFSIEFFYHIDLGFLGIKPRSVEGLIGIFTAPMIHGDYLHLLSNTVPLLFLGTILFFFYERIGGIVFFRCYFITNILVWIFSPRMSYHIGGEWIDLWSGCILDLLRTLKQDFISLIVSAFVFFIYGGIFLAGVLPSDPRISWESHLAGALVGLATAFNLAQKRRS